MSSLAAAAPLGLVGIEGADHGSATPPSRPPPTSGPSSPDCRTTHDCEPAEEAAWTAAELYALGEREAALARLDTALRTHPSSWMLMERRARVLLGLGRLAEASQQYEAERALLAGIADPPPPIVHLREGAEQRRRQVDLLRSR